MLQFQLLPGYHYTSPQHQYPGAPQFYHHSLFNMTTRLQLSVSASEGFQIKGLLWYHYEIPQSGYTASDMYLLPQFTGQGSLSPGAPGVPSVLPRTIQSSSGSHSALIHQDLILEYLSELPLGYSQLESSRQWRLRNLICKDCGCNHVTTDFLQQIWTRGWMHGSIQLWQYRS